MSSLKPELPQLHVIKINSRALAGMLNFVNSGSRLHISGHGFSQFPIQDLEAEKSFTAFSYKKTTVLPLK